MLTDHEGVGSLPAQTFQRVGSNDPHLLQRWWGCAHFTDVGKQKNKTGQGKERVAQRARAADVAVVDASA